MRLLVRGLLLAGIASPAFAADIDNSWLRGSSSFPADPPPLQRWNGVYGGGQVGADFYGIDLRGVIGNSITTISGLDANFSGIPLSNFPHLTTMNSKGLTYGGFVGYNYQIDDIVLGFELNFNRATLNGSMSDTQSHKFFVSANGNLYATTFNVITSAAAAAAEYGTIRARGGWAFGNFLPYAFAGISIGQINTSSSVNVNYLGTFVPPAVPLGSSPPPIGATWTQSQVSHGKWLYGFDVGLGVDYAVTRNLFLRGEAEYLQLGAQNDIRTSVASARAGAGLKF
jgi:outer membrane immunogenic protein